MSLQDDPLETIPVTRALRRSRGRWRIFAFLVLAIAVVVGFARFVPLMTPAADVVARVTISGAITTDPERTALLEDLAEDNSVAAIIVAINSPGGTTAGGEELYASLRALAEQKPVVSTIGELGASAAYMAAIATDRIYARNLSIVGSIGVYYQHVDASGLFETLGVDLDKVASGPLKGKPDFDEPISPQVRDSLVDLVDSSYQYFVDLVAERRGIPRSDTLALADGRILSGIMAIDAGLVDAAGGEPEALAWLQAEREIAPELEIVPVWPPRRAPGWLDLVFGSLAGALGETGWPGLPLDGLVSLWHPHAR
ncbi:signal peptide peptidase SppA [Pelagibacterium halotolerans]|uniref:Putative protease IV transmembrane protein n=1 Tax=Pelagibacterium halotolerans (strain DSM 22347 / JCM 15775 / CGMCC 1.7692 / B2) TaxID=1082931 RepID=G4R9D5_PELHB|nr:signal peptide peptidase SppA [Pelagibacterium halotolerans]AEQ53469.1 putative protease IV transmembrane protein [Pelagibacterium halotolerans B2]QJR20351.1 signal peptide peptidase SppA [Pelagibacterium halotolerans]SEA59527.1 signal peptide peptidase A. Serine peptidase. MEROPS family S49 [Pelagibacterium halotolerans]